MNKRIEQLAEQARDYARTHVDDCKQYGYHMEYNEFDLQFEQKFAELIVRECIDQVWYTREDRLSENICQVIAGRIKEQFGV